MYVDYINIVNMDSFFGMGGVTNFVKTSED